jgi:glycosyltransferase involved in cell wall biosynthesis
MRLVILGKFPPIEGGVSCQTYWTAVDLAERGHEVHLVTNSGEVEPGYREFLFGQDFTRLAGRHLVTPLHLHQTTTLRRDSFVPWANPYGSKLFGAALSVIEEFGCDLILGWYFEPYGLIATQVGNACHKPVVVRHAGSDIGRLAEHPDLGRSYRWMLSQTAAVLSTGRISAAAEILKALGVTQKQVRVLPVPRLPQIYSSPCEPLDLEDLLSRLPAWYQDCGLSTELADTLRGLNNKPFLSGIPTVGIYGKIGEIKGSYRLLEALDHLAQKGVQFHFLTIAGFRSPEMLRYCNEIAERKELARRTWVLPPLAPWRIPAFLRACNIVCYLEHDFPITFHTPMIPREVLASGACLVLSSEVAEKQSFKESLSDHKNVVLIPDPKDASYLAEQIGCFLADPQKARIIGKHGQYLSETCEKFFRQRNSTAEALEELHKEFA